MDIRTSGLDRGLHYNVSRFTISAACVIRKLLGVVQPVVMQTSLYCESLIQTI